MKWSFSSSLHTKYWPTQNSVQFNDLLLGFFPSFKWFWIPKRINEKLQTFQHLETTTDDFMPLRMVFKFFSVFVFSENFPFLYSYKLYDWPCGSNISFLFSIRFAWNSLVFNKKKLKLSYISNQKRWGEKKSGEKSSHCVEKVIK